MTEAERMMELLRYASHAKVGRALNVTRQTVGQWARGQDVSPFRLRQVQDLLQPQHAPPDQASSDELLSEMRAIRRLMLRRSEPRRIAREVASVVADLLEARGADASAPPLTPGASRHRKVAARAGSDEE